MWHLSSDAWCGITSEWNPISLGDFLVYFCCPFDLATQNSVLFYSESRQMGMSFFWKKRHGCVNADLQTKGRGTHGKKWISNRGILFGSIFFPLRSNYPPFDEFSIINPIIISSVIDILTIPECCNWHIEIYCVVM